MPLGPKDLQVCWLQHWSVHYEDAAVPYTIREDSVICEVTHLGVEVIDHRKISGSRGLNSHRPKDNCDRFVSDQGWGYGHQSGIMAVGREEVRSKIHVWPLEVRFSHYQGHSLIDMRTMCMAARKVSRRSDFEETIASEGSEQAAR
jgi:hypothetical protein